MSFVCVLFCVVSGGGPYILPMRNSVRSVILYLSSLLVHSLWLPVQACACAHELNVHSYHKLKIIYTSWIKYYFNFLVRFCYCICFYIYASFLCLWFLLFVVYSYGFYMQDYMRMCECFCLCIFMCVTLILIYSWNFVFTCFLLLYIFMCISMFPLLFCVDANLYIIIFVDLYIFYL